MKTLPVSPGGEVTKTGDDSPEATLIVVRFVAVAEFIAAIEKQTASAAMNTNFFMNILSF